MGLYPDAPRRNYLLDVGVADMDQVRLFWREDGDPIRMVPGRHCSVVIDRATWDEMGRPGKVLVTVSPATE